MTGFKLIGAAFALSAFVVAPSLAQVSEPAAAASQDPTFSIYSSGPSYGRPIVSQPYDANALAETRMSVRPHRTHRAQTRQY